MDFSRVFYVNLVKPNKQTSPLPEASGVEEVDEGELI